MKIKQSVNNNRFIGRIKIGQGVALTAALLGGVGFANAQLIVRPPEIRVPVFPSPLVILPRPDVFVYGGDYDDRREVRHYGHRGSESRGRAHGGNEGRRR
jgi:hypothetical protein